MVLIDNSVKVGGIWFLGLNRMDIAAGVILNEAGNILCRANAPLVRRDDARRSGCVHIIGIGGVFFQTEIRNQNSLRRRFLRPAVLTTQRMADRSSASMRFTSGFLPSWMRLRAFLPAHSV